MNKTTMHFLVVEDDDDHAKLIGLALEEQRGISFDRVSDGRTAISYLRQEDGFEGSPRPDVVLLDLNLPRMNGHQVLAEIKGDDTLRAIPVVVLTTSSVSGDLHRAYDNHANSYLVKPADFEQFDRMIAEIRSYWANCNTGAALAQ
jgi:CheY-like chemotaxis protein